MNWNIKKVPTFDQPTKHMPTPCVFIVILQYNNSQDTIRCLNSVKELDYPSYDVIIVDNGSEVKHIETIKLFIKNQEELKNAKRYTLNAIRYNLGYSGGNNIGIKYAIENGADYILILNPDTIIEKSALTKLVETAEANPQIGILGPVINEGNYMVYGGKIEWLEPELEHIMKHRTWNMKQNTYVSGAAMLIKRRVIEKIGLLDERYFLYFEDADYCERAKQAGYQLVIVPEAFVYHKPSSSTFSLGAPILLRYHFRNAHLFNWKNGPIWVKLSLPFWSIFIIIKQLIKIALIPAKREISKAILAGVGDFYKDRFGQIS